MAVIYSAVKRFGPDCGESWRNFIAWSGLTQLREVISKDIMLCPTVLQQLTDEDWQHNVQEDFKITLFYDLDYVLGKVAGDKQVNVLALLQNPTEVEVRSYCDQRFDFQGFDLVELQTGISALLNCGGFDKVFSPVDLSDCGLLADHTKAMDIQQRLRVEYPEEPHADCDMWAIWKLKMGPQMTGERP
jgi:hypothetical protein